MIVEDAGEIFRAHVSTFGPNKARVTRVSIKRGFVCARQDRHWCRTDRRGTAVSPLTKTRIPHTWLSTRRHNVDTEHRAR